MDVLWLNTHDRDVDYSFDAVIRDSIKSENVKVLDYYKEAGFCQKYKVKYNKKKYNIYSTGSLVLELMPDFVVVVLDFDDRINSCSEVIEQVKKLKADKIIVIGYNQKKKEEIQKIIGKDVIWMNKFDGTQKEFDIGDIFANF